MTKDRSSDRLTASISRAKNKIHRRFQRLLKPGATELDLAGIEGIPRKDSYMACLRYFEKTLPKEDMLFSKKEKKEFEKAIRAYVRSELQKCEELRSMLRVSPVAVRAYISELEAQVNILNLTFYPDPNSPLISDVLREHEKLGNKMTKDFIKQTKKKIEYYSEILSTLK